MILGHVAVPTILKHYFRLKPVPLYVGSLFPDVVDKGLQQAGQAVNGRSWAHTFLSVMMSTAVVRLLFGKAQAYSWALGYLGHLVCDADGFVPWFYPFAAYEFLPSKRGLWEKLKAYRVGSWEMILIGWAVFIFFKEP